jgi:hypothetical protein
MIATDVDGRLLTPWPPECSTVNRKPKLWCELSQVHLELAVEAAKPALALLDTLAQAPLLLLQALERSPNRLRLTRVGAQGNHPLPAVHAKAELPNLMSPTSLRGDEALPCQGSQF